jgi:hypothetical protein
MAIGKKVLLRKLSMLRFCGVLGIPACFKYLMGTEAQDCDVWHNFPPLHRDQTVWFSPLRASVFLKFLFFKDCPSCDELITRPRSPTDCPWLRNWGNSALCSKCGSKLPRVGATKKGGGRTLLDRNLTGFLLVRTGSYFEFFWIRKWTNGFQNRGRIIWMIRRVLAAADALCTEEPSLEW